MLHDFKHRSASGSLPFLMMVVGLSLPTIFQNTGYAFTMEVHLRITTEALKNMGYSQEAIAKVCKGNELTDQDEWTNSAAHFDSEKFEAGSKRLREKFDLAKGKLIACNRDVALEQIGRSLHAIQDFYSHSNYVELGSNAPKINLFAMKDPPESLICRPPGVSDGLTTGYWPIDKTPSNKCSHDDLAKDSAESGVIRHSIAVNYALLETQRFLLKFDNALKEEKGDKAGERLVRFLKVDPSKALAKDAPGCLVEESFTRDKNVGKAGVSGDERTAKFVARPSVLKRNLPSYYQMQPVQ